jgi:hypothetical protein
VLGYGHETLRVDTEKNEALRKGRGVSFEEVVFHIKAGDEADVFEHPNQERYPGQKISVVIINDYAYFIPFVESEDEIFLKTIIPSRKATKQYVGERHEDT